MGKFIYCHLIQLINNVIQRDTNQLTPECLGYMYGRIRGDYSYYRFSDVIGFSLQGRLTCRHISSAAMGVQDVNHKMTVLTTFSKYCCDKQFAAQEFPRIGLSPYLLSRALAYYQ